jgi:hypothetical protein
MRSLQVPSQPPHKRDCRCAGNRCVRGQPAPTATSRDETAGQEKRYRTVHLRRHGNENNVCILPHDTCHVHRCQRDQFTCQLCANLPCERSTSNSLTRTARQRFKCKRTTAGEQVQHARIAHVVHQPVEQGFAHARRRRAAALRRRENGFSGHASGRRSGLNRVLLGGGAT